MIYLLLTEQSFGRKVRSAQNLIKKIAAIWKHGHHFEIGGHFEFKNVKFGSFVLKFLILLDAKFFLEI